MFVCFFLSADTVEMSEGDVSSDENVNGGDQRTRRGAAAAVRHRSDERQDAVGGRHAASDGRCYICFTMSCNRAELAWV